MDAAAWNARYAASDRVWSAGPNQFVEAELEALAPGSAIDVAAGEGRNALWLAERGWAVTAVDYSDVAIERGRSHDPEGRVDWVVTDVTGDPLPDGLDLALISYLQLPRAQMREVWPRVAATLRPGGTFFLIGHDSSNLTEGTGGPQDPDHLYTADDVVAALGDLVEVQRAERVARVTDAGTAWDVLVRGVRR